MEFIILPSSAFSCAAVLNLAFCISEDLSPELLPDLKKSRRICGRKLFSHFFSPETSVLFELVSCFYASMKSSNINSFWDSVGFMSLCCDPGKIKCRKLSKALPLNMQVPDLKEKKKSQSFGFWQRAQTFSIVCVCFDSSSNLQA